MNALPSVPLPKASPVSGITTVPAQSGQQERSAPRAQAAAAAATQNLSEEEYINFIQQYEHYEYHDPIAERLLGDNRSTPEPYYSPYDPEQPEVEVDVEDNLCRAKEIGSFRINVSRLIFLSQRSLEAGSQRPTSSSQ